MKNITRTLAIIATAAAVFFMSALAGADTVTITGTANWSTCDSGSPPTAATAIVLTGTGTLTLDGTGTNNSYTCASITSGTAGSIVISNTSNPFTLTCGTISGASATNSALIVCGSNSGPYTFNLGTVTAGTAQHAGGVLQFIHCKPVTVNLSGTATGGAYTVTNVQPFGINSGTLTINGNGTGVLLGGVTAPALYAISSTVYLNNLTLQASASSDAYNHDTGDTTYCTNCNFINTAQSPAHLSVVNDYFYIVSSQASNYTQYATPTGTINFPSAATVMGPWPITNNAQGTATQIGPYTINQNPDGSFSVGPYPVH